MSITRKPVEDALWRLVESTGLSGQISRGDLSRGLDDLLAEAYLVVGEMNKVGSRGKTLTAAVFDEDYPHLTRFHGYFKDFLELEIPSEMGGFIDAIPGLMDPEEIYGLLDILTRAVISAENSTVHFVARFLLFELLCIIQRVDLLINDIELSGLSGDMNSIEFLAERELVKLESEPEYAAALGSLERPTQVLVAGSLISLDLYVDDLKRALQLASAEFVDAVARRMRLIEGSNCLEPADKAILLNNHAEMFGGDPASAKQLLKQHPLVLREMTPEAVRKRKQRLINKLAKIEPGRLHPTFSNLLRGRSRGALKGRTNAH